MKYTKFITIALITSMLSSCMAPIVSRALSFPAQLISTVTGPILGGF